MSQKLSLAFSVMILSGDCSYIQSSAYLGLARAYFQTLQQISLSDGGCKNMPFVCRYMSAVIPISPLRCLGSLLVLSFGPLFKVRMRMRQWNLIKQTCIRTSKMFSWSCCMSRNLLQLISWFECYLRDWSELAKRVRQ